MDRDVENGQRRALAQAVLDEVQRTGETRPMRIDEDDFRLVFDDTGDGLDEIRLHNLYGQWRLLPAALRAAAVTEFVEAIMSASACHLPAGLDGARPHLRAMVRPRAGEECASWKDTVGDHNRDAAATVPLGEHLVLEISLDFPKVVMGVHPKMLRAWGLELPAALEIARSNLQALGGNLVRRSSGLWVSASGDTYDTGRLLVDPLWDDLACKVRGNLIVMPLDRDTLVACGSEEPDALADLARIARRTMTNSTRFISGIPLVRRDGRWHTYRPARGHLGYAELGTLERLTLMREYAEQVEPLGAKLARHGTHPYISSLLLGRPTADGQTVSHACWTRGVPAVLPRADLIAFNAVHIEAGEVKVEMFGAAPWERVVDAVGHLLTPLGIYPERYLVQAFPTMRQLASIGLEQITSGVERERE